MLQRLASDADFGYFQGRWTVDSYLTFGHESDLEQIGRNNYQSRQISLSVVRSLGVRGVCTQERITTLPGRVRPLVGEHGFRNLRHPMRRLALLRF